MSSFNNLSLGDIMANSGSTDLLCMVHFTLALIRDVLFANDATVAIYIEFELQAVITFPRLAKTLD